MTNLAKGPLSLSAEYSSNICEMANRPVRISYETEVGFCFDFVTTVSDAVQSRGF